LRRDPHRKLHRRGAKLRHVDAALFQRPMCGRPALLAKRKEQMDRGRSPLGRPRCELARPLNGPRHAVRRVVDGHASRLEQDLHVESPFAKEVARSPRRRRDRGEEMPGGGALGSAFG
jgi:hypothetical protein